MLHSVVRDLNGALMPNLLHIGLLLDPYYPPGSASAIYHMLVLLLIRGFYVNDTYRQVFLNENLVFRITI